MASSKGALIRTTSSSKYPLAPLNLKSVGARRTARVGGDGGRLSRPVQSRGDKNSKARDIR